MEFILCSSEYLLLHTVHSAQSQDSNLILLTNSMSSVLGLQVLLGKEYGMMHNNPLQGLSSLKRVNSTSQFSIVSKLAKEGPVVIKAKSLSATPAVLPVVDPQDPSMPPQALPLHQYDQVENHLGPHTFDPHPQIHVATLDILEVSPGSIIGAHVEEQQRVGVQALVSSGCWRRSFLSLFSSSLLLRIDIDILEQVQRWATKMLRGLEHMTEEKVERAGFVQSR
ncbi:hypothetical protein QYF61_016391 [Mycteria americana]|uniref:Uncharacterized protein n=1 Tax=Mycteria americana TaxID=33587 RepID=A0AAN7N9B1_MYCAM|nr:hypothetical protein QYF61_016391 [Mycteria americana]